NEFRFQYAKSIIRIKSSINSASGVSVTINGMANFGPSPMIGSQPTDESTMQLQNAVTRVFQKHSWKIGGGVNLIHDNRGSPVTANYTFGSIADYRAAVSGPDRRTYLTYDETFGNNAVSQRSKFLNLFIQDYWDVSTRLKIALGLRYDLFHPPAADPASPLVVSRKFNLDKNNLAPRLGVTYLLRDGKYRTVIRAGSGLYYDAPFLDVYRRAVINNGSLRFFKFSFQPGSPGAPEFPHTLGLLPAGTDPVRQDIDAVSPDFATLFAMHSNFQIEQSLAENWSFTAGYLHTSGRHIPVYSNVNCRPIGGTLADGRPLFGTVSINAGEVKISGCTLRIAPEFQRIMMAESVGNSNYNALFLQLTKRLASGFQLNASYTLARARDDAPEQNVPGPLSVSDPSNRSFDRGTSVSDVRHTLALSMVLRPKFSLANGILRELLNHNQIGLIALANSGETFNITTVDLNRDGVSNSDRPVGIGRNAGRLPAFYNLDARISRFFSLLRDVSLELYAEGTNMLNRKSVFSYDSTRLTGNNLNTSQVNPLTGEIRGSLPDFKTLSVTYQGSRQLQFGIKFHF
ncbi:MAG: TonB-dependent receptor, partial [Pyrinomonadaceae bacterium]